MKGYYLQGLVGFLMIGFSLYQWSIGEPWEFALYMTAGLAFLSVAAIASKKFETQKKLLSVVSWILILGAVFLFFFLVRTDG